MSWRRCKMPWKKYSMSKIIMVDLTDVDCSCQYMLGIDEVGWGGIAGPLVVAGALTHWNWNKNGLKDSKRYTTDASRKRAAEFAKQHVIDYYVIELSPADLHKYGAGPALNYAQRKVIKYFEQKYEDFFVFVDGNKSIKGYPSHKQKAYVKGDAKIPAISAASIIAKVYRDEIMMQHPELTWEFYKNKGYPTQQHLKLLKSHGPIENFHRMNVNLVKEAFKAQGWYETSK